MSSQVKTQVFKLTLGDKEAVVSIVDSYLNRPIMIKSVFQRLLQEAMANGMIPILDLRLTTYPDTIQLADKAQ